MAAISPERLSRVANQLFEGWFEPLPLLFMAPRLLATMVVTSQANLRRSTAINDEDASFMD